jgi:hypothetical protein
MTHLQELEALYEKETGKPSQVSGVNPIAKWHTAKFLDWLSARDEAGEKDGLVTMPADEYKHLCKCESMLEAREKLPSDEEIEMAAVQITQFSDGHVDVRGAGYFGQGAKWMRDKLKGTGQ